MNSLWHLFSVSSKKTHALKEVPEALQEPDLALVRAGDTRWTSHYRAVKAVVKCLKGIIVTLQHLHQESGDLSSEAGGLLLTFLKIASQLSCYLQLKIPWIQFVNLLFNFSTTMQPCVMFLIS